MVHPGELSCIFWELLLPSSRCSRWWWTRMRSQGGQEREEEEEEEGR